MADSTGGEGRNGGGKPEPPITQAQAAAYAQARAYDHAVACAHARAYVSLAVKVSGLLAVLLSSVVLLGGYVQSLGKKDFLCITAITVIQAAGIFNDWENSIEHLNDFGDTIIRKFEVINIASWLWPPKSFFILLAYPFMPVILCVQMIYLLGPLGCAAISLWRITKSNHGIRDGTDSMANMMVALNLFYSLVIFQGVMFGVLFTAVAIGEVGGPSHFLALEQLLDEKWGKEVMEKYLSDISNKCRQDPISIRGLDLIKYAIELLDSESQTDYLYGARLLSAFVKKGKDVRSLLLPSRHKIQKLIESLRISSSLDESYLALSRSQSRCIAVMSSLDDNTEIRELAATIVADLAGYIDLAKYPESMWYISSLLQVEVTSQLRYWNNKQGPFSHRSIWLEPSTREIWRLLKEVWRLLKEAWKQREIWRLLKDKEAWKQIFMPDQRPRDREERRRWNLMKDQKRLMIREERHQQNKEGDASYELILQGLTILDRLASNNDNCRLICSDPGLLPKITAPLYSETLIQDVKIEAWAEVVTRSLKVRHNLIRTSRWTSRRLRHEISSNDQALSNLKSVLNLGNTVADQELQLIAMEILTELALDLSINLAGETKEILITKQLQVFLANGEPEKSAARAGKTLVSLSTNSESNSALIMTTQEHIIGRLTELLDAAKSSITHRIIAAEILDNLCTHCDVNKQHMKDILLPKVLNEIMSVKRESQQTEVSANQNNSDTGDEENPRYSASRNGEERHRISTGEGDHTRIQDTSTEHRNKSSDEESEEQEAFLSLTMEIRHKLNSADDFDYAILSTIGREAFVDKLKSIINDNHQATAECLRIVKLCVRIAQSTMQCQQYQQYAEHYRNKGFDSLLSEASKTMSRVESCMLFHGTDFGIKKTVRPLISDIRLERKL